MQTKSNVLNHFIRTLADITYSNLLFGRAAGITRIKVNMQLELRLADIYVSLMVSHNPLKFSSSGIMFLNSEIF